MTGLFIEDGQCFVPKFQEETLLSPLMSRGLRRFFLKFPEKIAILPKFHEETLAVPMMPRGFRRFFLKFPEEIEILPKFQEETLGGVDLFASRLTTPTETVASMAAAGRKPEYFSVSLGPASRPSLLT